MPNPPADPAPVPSEPVFHVRTRVEDTPVTGAESVIVAITESRLIMAVPGGGYLVTDLPRLGRHLRRLSEHGAAHVREVLHHADWWITDDPAVVEARGMHGQPDCATCRAGTDRALAHLAEYRQPLLVGILYYAGPA